MTSLFRSSRAKARRARSQGLLPQVDLARCTGCGRCVAACPLDLLSLHVHQWKKSAVLHAPQPCTACALCEKACPFDAIRMVDDPVKRKN